MRFSQDYLRQLVWVNMPSFGSDYNGEREQEVRDYLNMKFFSNELLKIFEGMSTFTEPDDIMFITGELSKLVEKLNLKELY